MSCKVKIRRVIERPKSGAPILLNFEHAGVNKYVDISMRLVAGVYEADSAQEHNSSRNPQLRPNKRKQVVVVQGETDMTYIGSSDGPLNSHSTGLRTFLAVRHKNKLKVYEATPMTVSPYIANRAHLKVADSKKPHDAEEKRKVANQLVSAFGSKKKRLAYERHEKNQIDGEHMNESINTATESATLPTVSPKASDSIASVLSLVPPCNRETKDVKAVYSLSDILTDEDLDGLETAANDWLNCSQEQLQSWKNSKQFSDYFFEMHRRLSARKGNPNSIHTAKLVLYTELLICLLKLKFGDFRKKIIPLPNEFPAWLVDKALSTFTVVNAGSKIRCRSDAYKDKTCCYVMVLVLLANEFIFDVSLMSTSLQIHINKLLTLAKAVGITVNLNASTKEYKALLKVPLPKPIERRGGRTPRKK